MPKRDADLLVEDMLGAIRKIGRYTAGMDQEAFRQAPRLEGGARRAADS